MAEMTTARALVKFAEELGRGGFVVDEVFELTRIAAEHVIAGEGLCVKPDDDPDPDVPEVGTVSLRVVPDLSPVRALVDAV